MFRKKNISSALEFLGFGFFIKGFSDEFSESNPYNLILAVMGAFLCFTAAFIKLRVASEPEQRPTRCSTKVIKKSLLLTGGAEIVTSLVNFATHKDTTSNNLGRLGTGTLLLQAINELNVASTSAVQFLL